MIETDISDTLSSKAAANYNATVDDGYMTEGGVGRALPPSWQLIPVVLLLALVEALLLGDHLLHGGLYTDDWPLAAIQRQSGTSGLFENLIAANHERPLGVVYQTLTTALSGTNPHIHALWGLLTLLAATSAVYLLLRLLSLRTRDALAVVLLFMVFPFADSAWLWYAASHSYLAIALAALGGSLALVGLRREGRTAVVYHVGALVLFAASILTYQVAAVLICLSLLVYLPRVPRRRAIVLWISDVSIVALASGLPRLITGSAGTNAPDAIIPLHEQINHAKLMANQGLTLLTAVLVPFGGPHRNVVLPIALVIACIGALLAWSASTNPALRRELRRWLLLVAAGGLVVAAAYVVYVPAPINLYQPLAKGLENRVNVLASLGYAIIVYALAMILATSTMRLLRRPLAWASVMGLVIVAVVFVGYVHRTRKDIAAWNLAGDVQRQEISDLRAAGQPPDGTTIYAFGGTGATAPGVFAFRVTWDLNSAVQLLWNDATLHAYPIFTGTQMTCTATQIVPIGLANGDGVAQAANYGSIVFYDFRNGHRLRVMSRAACEKAVKKFAPEPVEI
jgi:hypothetical protein